MKMIEQMLARYPEDEREHAIREVMQEIALDPIWLISDAHECAS